MRAFRGVARRRLAAFGAGTLALVACAGCVKRDVGGEPEFVVGLCHTRTPEDLRLVEELGAAGGRHTLRWRSLEPKPGTFVIPGDQRTVLLAAARNGQGMVTPIAYGNPHFDDGGYPVSDGAVAAYARAAKFAATVLRHPQPVFEIWNEWNLGIGMGDRGPGAPEDYVRLQAAAYAAIQETRTSPFVLGGSLAGAGLTDDWLERACEAGMLEHLDGLSFHPYCYWMEGGQALPERGMLGLIASLEAIVARFPGGAEVPLYLTEFGWPTHEGPDGVTLEAQAQYAARALFLLRANPRIKGVWWFNLRDHDSSSPDLDHRFGLLFSDGTPKPSWFAFRDATRWVRETSRARHERLGGTVHAVWLDLREGDRALALWVARPGAQARIELEGVGVANGTVQVIGSGESRSMTTADGRATVSVGNMPVVICGLAAEAAVVSYRVTGRIGGKWGGSEVGM